MYPLVIVLAQMPRHEAASLLAKYGHGFPFSTGFLEKINIDPFHPAPVKGF